ncbi:Cyclic beta-(1,2)-glucan synthase NdvB [bioreactor metagenome]|uniref:Cyclic beta-(1,2)-glucan synthase NdvB n=1 Tax=bioreactor metagenome TaxID=1076179 RepID=A0A644YEU8_9ZZZZ
MEAVDKYLVDKDKGLIKLLAPPFDKSPTLEPGYIKGYVPGVRENGGQYTHAAVWVILALTKLGLGDKAWKYYNMINPINHTNTELEARNYKVEPYVMAADVYIKEPHGGRGGWSWYTGASGWMYKVGLEDILGLKKIEGKGYKIDPCIPETWKEYEININNENEDYNIKIKRGEHKKIIIDGEEVKDNLIPKDKGKLNIEVVI